MPESNGSKVFQINNVESKELDEKHIKKLIDEIDLHDSSSIMFFGSKAQHQLTDIADSMLDGVKNKDVAAAGSALNDIVATLRGFDVIGLNPNKPRGFLAKLLGTAKPAAKFLQQYEEVRRQIESITIELEKHKTKLLTDITTLDRLYQANLEYFHELDVYIAAGQQKLDQLDNKTIPALAKTAEISGDMIKAQELRDLRGVRDDLERRIHDLRLTRQVAMQSLPSIRLVQENDKGLVNKISSTIVNTVPLWRQQLATAVTLERSRDAAQTVKAASDLTNQLLEANADVLKQSNREARTQMERGVFDIESVKKANQMLIDTIEESLRIADQGKQKRAEAQVQLEHCETELKNTLKSASAKRSGHD
jgi:uncharacterized protein YaaN involved in tellurite resistance